MADIDAEAIAALRKKRQFKKFTFKGKNWRNRLEGTCFMPNSTLLIACVFRRYGAGEASGPQSRGAPCGGKTHSMTYLIRFARSDS